MEVNAAALNLMTEMEGAPGAGAVSAASAVEGVSAPPAAQEPDWRSEALRWKSHAEKVEEARRELEEYSKPYYDLEQMLSDDTKRARFEAGLRAAADPNFNPDAPPPAAVQPQSAQTKPPQQQAYTEEQRAFAAYMNQQAELQQRFWRREAETEVGRLEQRYPDFNRNLAITVALQNNWGIDGLERAHHTIRSWTAPQQQRAQAAYAQGYQPAPVYQQQVYAQQQAPPPVQAQQQARVMSPGVRVQQNTGGPPPRANTLSQARSNAFNDPVVMSAFSRQ